MSNADPVLHSARALRALADEIDQLARHVGDAHESRPELGDRLDALARRFSCSTLVAIEEIRRSAHLNLSAVDSALTTGALPARKFASLDPAQRWWHEALASGAPTGYDEWPYTIPRREARELVVIEARRLGRGEPPTMEALGRALARMCPSMSVARRRVDGGTRQYVYVLPSLRVCRAQFEAWLGASVEWSEELADVPRRARDYLGG